MFRIQNTSSEKSEKNLIRVGYVNKFISDDKHTTFNFGFFPINTEAMTHTLIAGLGDELPLTVYAGV